MERNLSRRHWQGFDLDTGQVQVDQLAYALNRRDFQVCRQALA